MLVLFPHREQLLEKFKPLGLEFARVHKLLIVFPPIAYVALLGDKLRGIALVGLQEVHGFPPFAEPTFVLRHIAEKLDIIEFIAEYRYCRQKSP